jgi:hypothetical protein
MDVNGDERFEFDTFQSVEILGRLLDERVEDFQEFGIGFLHHFAVVSALGESRFSVSSPQHLKTEDTHLRRESGQEFQQIELGVLNGLTSQADDGMQRTVGFLQETHQPYFNTAFRTDWLFQSDRFSLKSNY